jgi:zinc transport system substrate-binding protein
MFAIRGYRNQIARIVSLFITISIASALVNPGKGTAGEKLNIYVVNYPLKYFAERIAGEQATVVFPAPPDEDPAYWMPDAKTISAYQRADLILLNGANYAKWINKVSLPRFRMVNTSAGFKDQYIEAAEILTHSHGAEGEHAHEALAFTTWIDFSLAAKQAKAIAQALSRKKPALADTFQRNYKELEKDLLKLDRDMRALVSKHPSKPFIASHPVYDYLARGYGFNIKSVHWEPDEVPDDRQLMELQNILKDHPAKWMIWEGEPAKASVERLKIMGMESLVFDPCGNVPDQGDFMAVMLRNVENLKTALQEKSP